MRLLMAKPFSSAPGRLDRLHILQELEQPGAADRGLRGAVIAARRMQFASAFLMIQDLPDDEGFRMAPGLVIVAAEGDETIEDDIAGLHLNNVEFCPLHERAEL